MLPWVKDEIFFDTINLKQHFLYVKHHSVLSLGLHLISGHIVSSVYPSCPVSSGAHSPQPLCTSCVLQHPSFAEDSWSSDYFFFWTHWAETRCFHFFRQRSIRNLSDLLVYLASSYWTTVPRVWSCFTLQHRKAQAAPEDLSMCRSSILCRARMCLCLCIDTKINFAFKDSGKGSRLLLGLSRQVLSCKVFLCVSFFFFLNGMLNILWFCVFFSSCEAALGFIYLFVIDLFILCVRSFCLHVCMRTPRLVSSKVREGIRFPGTGVRGDYGLLCGFWESNRGHLDKHPVS